MQGWRGGALIFICVHMASGQTATHHHANKPAAAMHAWPCPHPPMHHLTWPACNAAPATPSTPAPCTPEPCNSCLSQLCTMMQSATATTPNPAHLSNCSPCLPRCTLMQVATATTPNPSTPLACQSLPDASCHSQHGCTPKTCAVPPHFLPGAGRPTSMMVAVQARRASYP